MHASEQNRRVMNRGKLKPSSSAAHMVLVVVAASTSLWLFSSWSGCDSSPSGVMIKGHFVSSSHQGSMKGVTIALCPLDAQDRFVVDMRLTATATEDGNYEIRNVPPGKYVVLYCPSHGECNLRKLKGRQIPLPHPLTSGFTSEARKEFTATFGGPGPGAFMMAEGTRFNYRGDTDVYTIIEGAIMSPISGFVLNFEELHPLFVEIATGSAVNLVVPLWWPSFQKGETGTAR